MRLLKRLWVGMVALALGLFCGSIPTRADVSVTLTNGWNLLGCKLPVTITGSSFSDPDKVTSLWKWVKTDKGKTWAVYIPGGDGGEAYALAKGFQHLKALEPGEGFWVNSKGAQTLSLTGSVVTQTKIVLEEGWNLKGLNSETPLDVSKSFSDSQKFVSVWVWDTSINPPSWAVYLSGQDTVTYANQKGFKVLSTISPGQGFWVNVNQGQSAEVSLVELPPLVGKVSELIPTGDKGTYKPVSNATVYVDGKEIGKTDSQGKFEVQNFTAQKAQVKVSAEGYIQFNEEMSIPESKQIYIFLQKQDPVKNTIEGPSLDKKAITPLTKIGYILKPVPKTLKSKDDEAIVVVTNMKLNKDITVAVTPYKGLNVIPGLEEISNLDLGGEAIPVAGANIDMVDSYGKPITNEEAGFQGTVSVSVKKILGKYTIKEIEDKLKNKEAELALVAKGKEGWYKVPGNGSVEKEYLKCVEGTSLNKLHSFVFMLVSKKQTGKITLTGQVKDKETQAAIPGVFIGVDGFPEYSITDDKGNFNLALTFLDQNQQGMSYLNVWAWVDGYYGETINVPIKETGKALSIQLKPFGDKVKILGKVKEAGSAKPIEGAKVLLKAPTVLDQIKSDQNKVTVGKDEDAIYEWKIYDQSNANLLKTIKGKGKNYLLLDEISDKIQIGPEGFGMVLIELNVLFVQKDVEAYTENALGYAIQYKLGQEVMVIIDLYPSYSAAPFYEVWTDEYGNYGFYQIPKSMLPYLKISAGKQGYYSSPFEGIVGNTNVISKDISLNPKPVAQDVIEDFESGVSGWTSKVLVEGVEDVNSNVSWQVLAKPETIQVNNKVMEYLSQGTVLWENVEGVIKGITLNSDLSTDFYKVYTATLSYIANGSPKAITLILYDIDVNVPGYDYFGLFEYDQDTYIWWDFEKYPSTDYGTYPIQEGSKLMVSYKKIPEKKPVYLPTAYNNEKVFWFGNLKETQFKGTYYDSKYPKNKIEGVLTSPIYDLTYFDSPVLNFQTWFELSSTKTASLVVEIAVVDDTMGSDDTLTIESSLGSPVKLKKGQFVPLAQINPLLLYGMGYLDSLFGGDADEDGIPDMFEMGNIEPGDDPDGDGLINLAEWVAGLIPGQSWSKHITMPPISTNYMSDDPTFLEWMPIELNLKPFGGHKIQLRFRFIYKNYPGSLFRGWAIDYLTIKDMESWYPFQLLTQEFGYGNVVDLPEPPKPVSWEGSYMLQLKEVLVTDMDTLDVTSGQELNTQVVLDQEKNLVTFNFKFYGKEIKAQGYFDTYYKELSLSFYDAETFGVKVFGWAIITQTSDDGTKSGSFYVMDYDSGKMYEGVLKLLP